MPAQTKSKMFCAWGQLGEYFCIGYSGEGDFLRDQIIPGHPWCLVGIGSHGSRTCGSGKQYVTLIPLYISKQFLHAEYWYALCMWASIPVTPVPIHHILLCMFIRTQDITCYAVFYVCKYVLCD